MHKKRNTILVVNSDPQIQKLMSIILSPAEFKIIECRTGKETTRLSFLTKPDLVLLDLTLPDMEGADVITIIREWSQAPIIMLTARGGDDDVIMALNMGASDYVIRPFNA